MAEYLLRAEIVGIRRWNVQGHLELETPLRAGRKHGVEYHWYCDGRLTSAEPYADGLPHGTARQWSDDGTLIGTYTLHYGAAIPSTSSPATK